MLLRSRLVCHYCGQPSRFTKKERRNFDCEHCLATNYFDQNGDVADVPPEHQAPSQQPPRRFARSLSPERKTPGPSTQPESSIFCPRCLLNQKLYTEAISNFLPDPEDPEYDRREAALPQFKKDLDLRYPQCCTKCEPKVRAQLVQATYNARSDHLRRLLERSRANRIADRLGWRRLLVSAGGFGHAASICIQLVWHFYGALADRRSGSPRISSDRFPRCVSGTPFPLECLTSVEHYMGYSLALGLMCIWWNPKWQHKLQNLEGKLVGLQSYFMAQIGLLGLRFAAWAVLSDPAASGEAPSVLHAMSLVTIAMLSAWSHFGIVGVRKRPPLNWSQDPAPLLSQGQFSLPEPDLDHQQRQSNVPNLSTFAPSVPPQYPTWKPPTPPLDSSDYMDWTPSHTVLNPQLKPVQYKSSEPTPFRGTLPALDSRGIHRNKPEPKKALGLPPGFFDRPKEKAPPPNQKPASDREGFAEAKFFPRDADTGLEGIFETVFSFQDDVALPTPAASQASTTALANLATSQDRRAAATSPQMQRGPETSHANKFAGIALVILVPLLAYWMLEITSQSPPSPIGYNTILVGAAVPLIHLALALMDTQSSMEPAYLLGLAAEILILAGVALARDACDDLFQDLWNKLALGAVALLLPQELWMISHARASRPSHHQPSHSRRQLRQQQASHPPAQPPELLDTKIPNLPPPFIEDEASEPPTPIRRHQQPRRTSSNDSLDSSASSHMRWRTEGLGTETRHMPSAMHSTPQQLTRQGLRQLSPERKELPRTRSQHQPRSEHSVQSLGLGGLSLDQDGAAGGWDTGVREQRWPGGERLQFGTSGSANNVAGPRPRRGY